MIRSMQDKFDQLNFTPFVNTNYKEDLIRQIQRQQRKMTESLAEVEESFVDLEDQMLKLISHQKKFDYKLEVNDELAMQWILKRPSEVMGLEAKKQAIKVHAAQQAALD